MNNEKISLRFNEAAEKYDRERSCFILYFEEYYTAGLSLIANFRSDFTSVLDLGAGTGLLTSFLFRYFPEAKYTLVDISNKMLKVAEERIKSCSTVQTVVADYAESLPEGKYDLVASALSIHHLEEDVKLKLYKNSYENLEENGYFINIDQFNAPSPFFNEEYNTWWFKYIDASPISEE